MNIDILELDRIYGDTERKYFSISASSFQDMVDSIDKNFPDAVKGRPMGLCETGEPYVEFSQSAIARPDDIEFVKHNVISIIAHRLEMYFLDTHGRVYWRMRPEEDEIVHLQVIRYDIDGPDIDFYTDKRCHLDNNWVSYKIYMRLIRTDKPIL